MSDAPSSARKFNRAEMSEILRRASDIEGAAGAGARDQDFTLEEIEEIAREVGIDPGRVRSAGLALPETPSIHAARVRLATVVPAKLNDDGFRQLGDDALWAIGPGDLRREQNALHLHAPGSALGDVVGAMHDGLVSRVVHLDPPSGRDQGEDQGTDLES